MMLQKRLLISILGLIALTGCSSTPHEALPLELAAPLEQAKPARPAPLHLLTEHYSACGKSICQTPADAQAHLRNQVEELRFIDQTNALLKYYESQR